MSTPIGRLNPLTTVVAPWGFILPVHLSGNQAPLRVVVFIGGGNQSQLILDALPAEAAVITGDSVAGVAPGPRIGLLNELLSDGE